MQCIQWTVEVHARYRESTEASMHDRIQRTDEEDPGGSDLWASYKGWRDTLHAYMLGKGTLGKERIY